MNKETKKSLNSIRKLFKDWKKKTERDMKSISRGKNQSCEEYADLCILNSAKNTYQECIDAITSELLGL